MAEMSEIELLFKAGTKLVQVVSYERLRVFGMIHKAVKDSDVPIFRWVESIGLQMWTEGRWEIIKAEVTFLNALQTFQSADETDGIPSGVLILEDCHLMLDENYPARSEVISRLRLITEIPRSYKKILVFSQPIKAVPMELEKDMSVIEVPLPNMVDLKRIAIKVVKEFNLDAEKYDIDDEMLNTALGLTIMEAENVFAKAVVRNDRLDSSCLDLILEEKEQIIKKKGMLEFYKVKGNLDEVGGLDQMKAWLQRRVNAFSPGASDWGLEPPKGVLLLGIPGCGKSLSAKAVSKAWKMPLLRFDLGKVFGGIVGQSEANVRRALDIAEALSPSILWIDEIEKGLSGLSSSGQADGGVTARVFGTFLTWMQEKTKPVFVLATANSLVGLPPELLRKGRFDEIFFVDLPTEDERKIIFNIHTKKHRPAEKFDLDLLAKESKGFTGAEIEEAVKEGLFISFNDEVELNTQHIINAMKSTVPMSTTQEEYIRKTRKWASTRATFASSASKNLVDEKSEIPKLKQETSFNPFVD